MPAANVKEVWPIAHIAAYKKLLGPLSALHDSLSAGSGMSTSPAAVQREIMDLLKLINDLTNQSWSEYVAAASAHPLHAESLMKSGVPEHITFDFKKGFPFLTWLTVMDGPQLNWNQIQVNIEEDKSGDLFLLTPPFRPIHVDSLPATTKKIPIADPVHAATVAVLEVMEAAYADLTRAITSVSARDSWVRMRCVATFYTAVVQERMKELALDDYRDWVPVLPAQIPILNAPAVIARHGSNAVVIQLLALRTVANFVFDCMDRAEQEPSNYDQAQMVDQVINELKNYLQRIAHRADSLNSLLVSDSINDPENYSSQMVSRPVPRGTPFIALIPLTNPSMPNSNVTEFRR